MYILRLVCNELCGLPWFRIWPALIYRKKVVFLLPRIEPQFLERPARNLVTKLHEVFTLVPSTGSCFYFGAEHDNCTVYKPCIHLHVIGELRCIRQCK
jgi:hypothetical protein